MEVVLVIVLIVIISSISLPFFSGSLKGTKLRTAARTITRISKYARNMAIMREETMTVALNRETMEIFAGGPAQTSTNAADGKLDQDVLKNLNYIEGDASEEGAIGMEKEIHRFLPDGLTVRQFVKDEEGTDEQHENLYLIRFYPNGQCDRFLLEIEDRREMGIKLENDPVSGRIRTEFTQ